MCLTALGVKIDLDAGADQPLHCEAGVGFMFAPAHHASMKHVGPTRVELGTRTIFNLLGPLSNPAGVRRQVTGVFAKAWVEPLAHVLNNLGCGARLDLPWRRRFRRDRAFRHDLDRRIEGRQGDASKSRRRMSGIARASAAELKGGDAAQNAEALRGVLEGRKNAFRDAAVMTAAAALLVAGKASNLTEGVGEAQKSIDGGGARAVSRSS